MRPNRLCAPIGSAANRRARLFDSFRTHAEWLPGLWCRQRSRQFCSHSQLCKPWSVPFGNACLRLLPLPQVALSCRPTLCAPRGPRGNSSVRSRGHHGARDQTTRQTGTQRKPYVTSTFEPFGRPVTSITRPRSPLRATITSGPAAHRHKETCHTLATVILRAASRRRRRLQRKERNSHAETDSSRLVGSVGSLRCPDGRCVVGCHRVQRRANESQATSGMRRWPCRLRRSMHRLDVKPGPLWLVYHRLPFYPSLFGWQLHAGLSPRFALLRSCMRQRWCQQPTLRIVRQRLRTRGGMLRWGVCCFVSVWVGGLLGWVREHCVRPLELRRM